MSSRAAIRRAYVVQIVDGADGSPAYPAADGGKTGDYTDMRKHDGRGAHGIYIRYLDQENSPVVGPVPVMQWQTAVPAQSHPFRKAAAKLRAQLAAKANAAQDKIGAGTANATGKLDQVSAKAGGYDQGMAGKASGTVGSVGSKAQSVIGGAQKKADSVIKKSADTADKLFEKLVPKFLKPTSRPWGSRFIPRVGSEVLVAHYLGRPDLPVIVGSLFTADIARRFPPTAKAAAIVPGGDRPLQQPDGGKAVDRAISAKGEDLSYIDTSLRRGGGERNWSRNLILFDDGGGDGEEGDNPSLVLHAEGDLVVDVRGFLDLDPEKMIASARKKKKTIADLPYKFGKYFHTVGGTYRNVVKDWTCTTILRHAELRTEGDASFENKGLDFTLAINSLSTIAWAEYKSVEWSLSARFVMPTLTDCTVGAIKGLHLIHLVKPKTTLDHDHKGLHLVLKVLDYKQTEKKTETVGNALELTVKDTITCPKATLKRTVELRLAKKRTITDESHERKGLVEIKIARTCTEQVGFKLEV